MGRKPIRRRPANNQGLQHRNRAVAEADSQGTVPRELARRDGGFPASEPGGKNRYVVLAVCGFLVLAAGLVFGQTVCYQFINFDDDIYIYENWQVSRGLSAEGICWAFTDRHNAANWHPLTWLSLMVDCQFYGLNAGGHHLTNDLLHAATAVLLFLVLWKMTGGFWPSALVATIFAVHPLRAESVAWVTERKDVLSGLFFMLTLAAYVRYVRRPFSLGRYLLLALVFSLGLMAKQSLVTLPFVLLLLDYWPLRRFAGSPCLDRTPARTPPHCNAGAFVGGANFLERVLGRFPLRWQLVLEKVPLFLLAAVFSMAAVWAASETLMPMESLPLWWRIGNALISYVAYLGQFFYPLGLAAFYPRPGLDLPLWKIGGAFLILLGATATVYVGRRRCPYLLVGWLWYLGMLVPVIGLVQVGIGAMADRFTYLPQIGLCVAVVWAATDLFHRWHFRYGACGIASASLLAVLMACAWRQTSIWRDSETLWTHALACTAPNPAAHDNLGAALFSQGRLDEAMAHYQKALELKPDDVGALNNLGHALANGGQFNEAMAHYRTALKIKPDDVEALNNLGAAFFAQGRLAEATAHYRKALEIKPDYVEALNNLGAALFGQGQLDEAVTQYQKALEIDPDSAEAHGNLGLVLASQGRLDGAMAQYRKALDLATQHNNQALAAALRAKIAQYEAGKLLPPPRPASVRLPPKP